MAIFAVSLGACAEFDNLAIQVAHAQVDAAQTVRRNGTLAFSLCRDLAAYKYLEMTLGLGRQGPEARPPTFSLWYESDVAAHDDAGAPIPWSSYCLSLDRTGEIYHQGVLAVGGYALAIEALAEGKDFDGSGLAAIGSGTASVISSFSGPSAIGSVAKGLGSATATLSATIVSRIRTHELKTLVATSKTQVADVIAQLLAYLGALEDQRRLVVHERGTVLKLIDAHRDPSGAFTTAAASAISLDLAMGEERHLVLVGLRLASDDTLMRDVGKAQAELAVAAASKVDCAARDAADTLSRLVSDLKTRRPEEP